MIIIAILLYASVGLYIDWYFNKRNERPYSIWMTVFNLILWPMILECFFYILKLDRKLKEQG